MSYNLYEGVIMKNNIKIIFLCTILLLSGCSTKSKLLKNIEIEDNTCKLIKEDESHSGFLGDGDYFAILKCTRINYQKLSKYWYNLPLSDSLLEATQLEQCTDKKCQKIYDKYEIPTIKNGYYYFIDRNPDNKNKHDDKNLNNRASYNFTLALLDRENNTIYYYELDT